LLIGIENDYYEPAISLDFIIERICIGGWPTLINESYKNALNMNRGYIDLLCGCHCAETQRRLCGI
jgi:hypothetical protein